MTVRYPAACLVGLAASLLLTSASRGEYAPAELEQVPVERLIANLEEVVKKSPRDVQALVNLAHVHGMAYALKTDTAQVRKGQEARGPWFGYEPKLIPFSTVHKTDDADKQKAARTHLEKAVRRFKEALALAPDDLKIQLGHAWVLEQSGNKEQAIREYRALIEQAWKKEKDLKSLGLGGHTVVGEAAGYLVPLLDKDKDREEIATLTERAA